MATDDPPGVGIINIITVSFFPMPRNDNLLTNVIASLSFLGYQSIYFSTVFP